VLSVDNLSVHYPVTRGVVIPRVVDWVYALNGVSFTVEAGEILGVVGESGSGKTTLLRACLFLEQATSGDIRFHGESLMEATTVELQRYRAATQVVFQNPRSSLDPALRNGRVVSEPLHAGSRSGRRPAGSRSVGRSRFDGAIGAALREVGLEAEVALRYPAQLSGGQQQRVAIARGTTTRPEILFADECVSALDVSVQARVLQLLLRLRDELGFAMVFVTHDLGVVRAICDTVLVLKDGNAVEYASADAFFRHPEHPYSQELLRHARATEIGDHP
jgi:peptide/nickel transport system ATP-binding protein